MVERKCARCGQVFMSKGERHKYCNRHIIVNCAVCGKPIETTCSSFVPTTCSPACASKYLIKSRKCKICGEEFIPSSSRQNCCNRTKIKRCVICGGEFEYTCNSEGSRRVVCKL